MNEQMNNNEVRKADNATVPEKKEPPKSPPQKELSVAERQKRKKMLIMPLFFLIFGGAMWLIFAPSDKEETSAAGMSGLNAELPIPKDEGIVSDKRDAYEREALRQKEQERMRSLQDVSAMFDQAEQEDYPSNIAPEPSEYYESESHYNSGGSRQKLQASAHAYQDINRQLGSWYEEESTGANTEAQLAVEERMKELERKIEEAEASKAAEAEQFAMMEKSYQMAARYMPQQAGQAVESNTTTAAPSTKEKVNVQAVKQVRHNVVSLLSVPMSNDEFVESFSQPRNMGFFTAAGNEGVKDKNSIRACVNQTVTLTSGREVQIRLLEPMQAGEILIPANSLITGSCKITGERLDIAISSIQYADNIIPVEIAVYDMDGQRGIFIPGSDEIKAVKEVASTLASSSGTSIMISDDAGSQLAADMGKGLIQGASQYVSKKMSVVKVTLKANHRLLLLPKAE